MSENNVSVEVKTALDSVDGDYPTNEKDPEGHQDSYTPMSYGSYLFTSESVAEGHPDKICDAISDAVVDLAFKLAVEDSYPLSEVRVACETLATTNTVVLAGELRVSKSFYMLDAQGNIQVDSNGQQILNTALFDMLVRDTVKEIGYDQDGFSWRNLVTIIKLHGQSPDIAQGVDLGVDPDLGGEAEIGAGDQGIMFGYATSETDSYMPAPIHYAHRLTRLLAEVRHNGPQVLRTIDEDADLSLFEHLGPDAKSQVTFQYQNGRPLFVDTVVVSSQYTDADAPIERVYDVIDPIISQALEGCGVKAGMTSYVNPTGKFVIGGPDGDAGLTGRKIIVDTYGGAAPHGGGAFSGKDPTKVDRSAAYAARHIAKNIVASGLAERCTIQLSYAIGVPEPVSIYVDTHSTSPANQEEIIKVINNNFDLTPAGIIKRLQLLAPIYRQTASGGHFGRESYERGGLTFFPWEKLDATAPFEELLARKSSPCPV